VSTQVELDGDYVTFLDEELPDRAKSELRWCATPLCRNQGQGIYLQAVSANAGNFNLAMLMKHVEQRVRAWTVER
jgi:hypothetical protein